MFALFLGLVDFTAFFGSQASEFRHVQTDKTLNVVKQIPSNPDLYLWCVFSPKTSRSVAESLIDMIIRRFEFYNGPFAFDCIQHLSSVLSQIFLDGKTTCAFNQIAEGVEYAAVDRQTFLEMYGLVNRFSQRMAKAGNSISGFAVTFKSAVVASSLTPDQLLQISRERAKSVQIYFPEKKFLMTAVAANFRFFFIFESLPDPVIFDLNLEELIRASETAHARLESNSSENSDSAKFIYTNSANNALRISADSRGRKFQADDSFCRVAENLEEEVFLLADGNWFCGRQILDRRAFILVEGSKMKKINSLGECKGKVENFCKTTLGSVFMP